MLPKVCIFTEGGTNIGLGHISRCLSIYQAFQEKNIIPDFIINSDIELNNILESINYETKNWLDFSFFENKIKGYDIILIDSYKADIKFYEELSKNIKIPVFLDDYNRLNYPNGIILNGSIYSTELDYGNNKKLVGIEYIPLRKEFWNIEEKIINENIESILITLGGDDFRNLTPIIIDILNNNFPNTTKNIIVGNAFKNKKEIEYKKNAKTNLFFNPTVYEIKDLMLKSDIAISSAGQTLYELVKIGIPTISILVIENQLNNILGWEKNNIITSLGIYNDIKLKDKLLLKVDNLSSKSKRELIYKKSCEFMSFNGSINIVNSILKLV